jgi:hypothetical protein
MANRLRSEGKESFWREAIARQAASGLSVRAFCRRESPGEPSFYACGERLASGMGIGMSFRQASSQRSSSNPCRFRGPSVVLHNC